MKTFGVGVSYGPVARSRGETALRRSKYQRPGSAVGKDGSNHLQGWLLLPADAPAWANNTDELWTRAAVAERRRDAREAIFLDVSWPRSLPLGATDQVVHAVFDQVVHAVFDQFVARGLAVQVDLETKPASDGGRNDHLHGLVTVRAIDADGFVHQKARWLTDMLHSSGGRWARRIVAAALTEAAVHAGIKVAFDPSSNAARGLLLPEDRLPRSYIRNPDGQAAQHMLTRQAAQRRNAVEFHAVADQYEAVGRELDELSAAFDGVVQKLLVITPVTVDGALSPVDLETARHLQEGLQSSAEPPATIDGIGIVIPVGEGAVVDDGSMLKCEPPISTDTALVVSRLCRHRGWSRVEIESPKDQPLVQFDWYRMHQDIDLEHRIPDAARRAAERLAELLEVPQSERALLLSRLVDAAELDGSADVQELVERIDICALADIAPPDARTIVDIASSTSTLDGAGLWRRWCKENQLAMADLPNTKLGEVLRPGRRILRPDSEMDYDRAAS